MFHIILFRPQIPPNTGNAIRLSANTGSSLHLVRPLGFELNRKEVARAGLDYADMARVHVHSSLDECLETLPRGTRVFSVETEGTRRYSEALFQVGDAFLYGSEQRGLPAEVMERVAPERRLTIPMVAGNRSLNLSNAVAVVVYEAWRQIGFVGKAGAD